MSARASPQTPLEELTVLYQAPVLVSRGLLRGRLVMEGREKEGSWG